MYVHYMNLSNYSVPKDFPCCSHSINILIAFSWVIIIHSFVFFVFFIFGIL